MQVNVYLYASAALLPELTLVPIEYEVDWAAGLVWTFWRKEKCLVPA
jgi:hypothetical protein